ncbi:hypothetical protein [Actinomyces bowdenii]|uniref:Uncharacterized protein n=1 Tax=Actinomyces bowdenii TaxID=131109 RepID=A0A853EG76_9ACTO|nr:hypothetical protein [Actinomyces bowdenii]MBF0696126.1 hypothetical protein [Actinomyces bowdenii]MCR2051975.1 hypothetical protein [Actinomyces bowdenii]NYS68299.1 hypothetical protein [Actinomyces bowdenii]
MLNDPDTAPDLAAALAQQDDDPQGRPRSLRDQTAEVRAIQDLTDVVLTALGASETTQRPVTLVAELIDHANAQASIEAVETIVATMTPWLQHT